MRANIANGNDVILAEAAVFELTKVMPRAKAEEWVKQACAKATTENKPLIESVKTLTGDSIPAGAIDWQALSQPENYLGEAAKMIDAAVQRAKNVAKL
jgi:adenylosuccinate lyase